MSELELLIKVLASGVAVSLVVAGVRWLLPKIPRAALPILAVVLGGVAEYLTSQQVDPTRGALYGVAAVWLREMVTTIQQHGLDSKARPR